MNENGLKLINVLEKEVMKKEEYYQLFQLFEKTKKVNSPFYLVQTSGQ